MVIVKSNGKWTCYEDLRDYDDLSDNVFTSADVIIMLEENNHEYVVAKDNTRKFWKQQDLHQGGLV